MLRWLSQWIVLGLLLSAFSGCATLDFKAWKPRKPLAKASAKHPVANCLCIWEPSEGTGLDGLPARGCAGQILFFASGIDEPVQVDGDIRIFEFDDQGTDQENARPIHQFDFDGPAWNTYLKEANIGASYYVFIPYMRRGAHQAQVTMRVRYTPKMGAAVYSKMATISLPGTRKNTLSGEALTVNGKDRDLEKLAAKLEDKSPGAIEQAAFRKPTTLNAQDLLKSLNTVTPAGGTVPNSSSRVSTLNIAPRENASTLDANSRIEQLEQMLQQLTGSSPQRPRELPIADDQVPTRMAMDAAPAKVSANRPVEVLPPQPIARNPLADDHDLPPRLPSLSGEKAADASPRDRWNPLRDAQDAPANRPLPTSSRRFHPLDE